MRLIRRNNGIYYIETNTATRKQIRISTKTRDLSEALKLIQENPMQRYGSHLKAITLDNFHKEYLEISKQLFSSSHQRNVECVFRNFLKHFDPKRNISTFHTLELEKYLLAEYNRSCYAAHIIMKVLKSAFNRAVRYELLKKNPFKAIKLPKLPLKQPEFLTEEELRLVLSNVQNQMLKNIIFFAFYTGMRKSEILTLTWEQVDLDNRTIKVRNSKTFMTKSREDRIIPMTPGVDKLLRGLKESYSPSIKPMANYVFFKIYGYRWSYTYSSTVFREAVKKAKLNKEVHFHSLRHSTASNLAIKGVSLYHIGAILGHKETRTTQIYAHLQQDCLFDAILKLEGPNTGNPDENRLPIP